MKVYFKNILGKIDEIDIKSLSAKQIEEVKSPSKGFFESYHMTWEGAHWKRIEDAKENLVIQCGLVSEALAHLRALQAMTRPHALP